MRGVQQPARHLRALPGRILAIAFARHKFINSRFSALMSVMFDLYFWVHVVLPFSYASIIIIINFSVSFHSSRICILTFILCFSNLCTQ